jgi:periplasmic protein TonB
MSSMPVSVILFRDLPATFPEKDKYRKPSVIGSVVFHGLLIVMVLLIPLLLPQSISERQLLITLVSPIGPPPPPPPPAVELPVTAVPQMAKPEVRPAAPQALVMPAAIPKDIVKIVEEPAAPPIGVVGGVPGGIPGGVLGGVLGGILNSNASANALPAVAPPPPQPPPVPKVTAPSEPIRVGGNVREPRALKMVSPIYPQLASRARVAGTVVLEATITEQGTVEEIRVISGHPLLIDAAIACVKQWQYEPTLLNGTPVAVILTAKVRFERAPIS